MDSEETFNFDITLLFFPSVVLPRCPEYIFWKIQMFSWSIHTLFRKGERSVLTGRILTIDKLDVLQNLSFWTIPWERKQVPNHFGHDTKVTGNNCSANVICQLGERCVAARSAVLLAMLQRNR